MIEKIFRFFSQIFPLFLTYLSEITSVPTFIIPNYYLSVFSGSPQFSELIIFSSIMLLILSLMRTRLHIFLRFALADELACLREVDVIFCDIVHQLLPHFLTPRTNNSLDASPRRVAKNKLKSYTSRAVSCPLCHVMQIAIMQKLCEPEKAAYNLTSSHARDVPLMIME